MKKNFKYIASALLAGFAVTACSPDEFTGADQNGKATVGGVEITVDVDQETNTVTMSSPHLQQAYPYWSIQGVRTAEGETDFYSNLEKTSKVFALCGDKKIVYRVANRNGFSDAAIEKTIHIDNSLTDLEGLAKAIASEKGKKWTVAAKEEAHFGYGPNGSDGSGTWTVDLDNKENLALYDDEVNFFLGSSKGNFLYEGKMDYNPGEDGNVQFGGNGVNDRRDADKQNDRAYKISVSGDDVLLTLAPNTNMPFVPSDAFLANPVFRIDSYSSSLLVLVANDGDKAWRLVLTSDSGSEPGWAGFTAGTNLLEGSPATYRFWFSGPDDWNGMADPSSSGSFADGITFVMNGAGSDQWKAQMHIEGTGVTLSADKTYDFSLVIECDADEDQYVTVKPQKADDDNTFFSADKHLVKNGVNVIAFSDCAGFDGEFKIALDFAGAPEGTTFVVRDFFLSEHDAANVAPLNYNDEDNLWRTEVDANDAYEMEYYWAHGSGWEQIANPGFEVEKKKNGANLFTITASGATDQQWQAQNKFHTTIAATTTDVVDFSCVIIPNVDLKGVTVKLADRKDDSNNFFFANQVDLKANVATAVKFTDTKLSAADASAMTLIFDFGGNPEGAVIQITDIVIIKK